VKSTGICSSSAIFREIVMAAASLDRLTGIGTNMLEAMRLICPKSKG
jgi:hypothetical protein